MQNTLHRRYVVTRFRIRNLLKKKFHCPLCAYHGPFVDLPAETGLRLHAQCPRCGALERHRLQRLALEYLNNEVKFSDAKVLHVAPENFLEAYLRRHCRDYTSTDLNDPNVDVKADLCALPFEAEQFDLIFASHVLEHIKDDKKALSEIERVLKPKGVAILPVPLNGEETVEYPEPNPHETHHVRSPGYDYFDRYREFFKVELLATTDFPPQYQTYVYENRAQWPDTMPLRQIVPGEKHIDMVPICRKL